MFLNNMEKIFVLISVSFVLTAGNDVKDEGDREAHSDRQGLWFGPRLGKRSLHPAEDLNRDLYQRMLDLTAVADAIKYYDHQPMSERSEPDTRVTKKVIFTPKLGRSLDEEERRFFEFTPRLGRRLVEEIGVTPTDQEIYNGDGVGSRTRYFSPRLGRTMNFSPRLGRNINFSPRLGRELTYDYYPSVRVARSVNNTKNKQH